MRGIETPVRNVRRRIFKEIAKFGYEQKDLQDLEDLPYEIVPGEVAKYRDSIYRERAIVGERLRLAMGMSLNPADKPTRITKGIDESNISEKYYEPPLLQVIPSACNECKEKAFIVGEQCQGCLAHPCMEVCPKKAIGFKDGYSYIDQEKCIKCGQCKKVCPYGAIYERRRPCANAFGAGRGYAVASGVAGAIKACIDEYYPGTDVKIDHVEGLAECKKMLLQAKAGKKKGYLIEGMGCPGGCVAGAGTNIPVLKAQIQVKKFVKEAESFVPPETAEY